MSCYKAYAVSILMWRIILLNPFILAFTSYSFICPHLIFFYMQEMTEFTNLREHIAPFHIACISVITLLCYYFRPMNCTHTHTHTPAEKRSILYNIKLNQMNFLRFGMEFHKMLVLMNVKLRDHSTDRQTSHILSCL